jgi:four helix bundle protein
MSKEKDFENRLTDFSVEIIKFCKSIPESTTTRPIINQLAKSGTSMGANYCEANNASSRTDFKAKIFICKKEARETKYWLQIIIRTEPALKIEAEKLWQECHEFSLIFQKIVSTMNNKSSNEK